MTDNTVPSRDAIARALDCIESDSYDDEGRVLAKAYRAQEQQIAALSAEVEALKADQHRFYGVGHFCLTCAERRRQNGR